MWTGNIRPSVGPWISTGTGLGKRTLGTILNSLSQNYHLTMKVLPLAVCLGLEVLLGAPNLADGELG